MRLAQFYAFSTFAMQLNELEKSTEGLVPPTDSRLRPDIRALENGDLGRLAAHLSRITEFLSCWLPLYTHSHSSRTGKCREEEAGGKATHGPEKSLQVNRGMEDQASGAGPWWAAGAFLLPALTVAPAVCSTPLLC